ncbi:hypothetical protein HELRODRAFT_170808 [Helobdella robusta]|uniref:EGF-like domain-containing protein n=1 Tax=Helobdella robusta TaxID=6412 RepID=T1F3G5_HELRO|nr:hypothetical protein HELRODRAFT_170808 [Helobdella robusta]ESO06789.1 hypothetical protein HELRODRAFT_170808 [Helobdella robusta]
MCSYKCAFVNNIDTCLCPVGFEMTTTSCVVLISNFSTDINECKTMTPNPCDPNHGICINIVGSYICVCDDGYMLGPNNTCNDRNGNWATWGGWSNCSQMCNGGIAYRSRYCSSPSPQGLGRNCIGNATGEQQCNTQDCPLTKDEEVYGRTIYVRGLEYDLVRYVCILTTFISSEVKC